MPGCCPDVRGSYALRAPWVRLVVRCASAWPWMCPGPGRLRSRSQAQPQNDPDTRQTPIGHLLFASNLFYNAQLLLVPYTLYKMIIHQKQSHIKKELHVPRWGMFWLCCHPLESGPNFISIRSMGLYYNQQGTRTQSAPFSTNPACQLQVSRHDGYPTSMDCK
jgi:hypothetical protein